MRRTRHSTSLRLGEVASSTKCSQRTGAGQANSEGALLPHHPSTYCRGTSLLPSAKWQRATHENYFKFFYGALGTDEAYLDFESHPLRQLHRAVISPRLFNAYKVDCNNGSLELPAGIHCAINQLKQPRRLLVARHHVWDLARRYQGLFVLWKQDAPCSTDVRRQII